MFVYFFADTDEAVSKGNPPFTALTTLLTPTKKTSAVFPELLTVRGLFVSYSNLLV